MKKTCGKRYVVSLLLGLLLCYASLAHARMQSRNNNEELKAQSGVPFMESVAGRGQPQNLVYAGEAAGGKRGLKLANVKPTSMEAKDVPDPASYKKWTWRDSAAEDTKKCIKDAAPFFMAGGSLVGGVFGGMAGGAIGAPSVVGIAVGVPAGIAVGAAGGAVAGGVGTSVVCGVYSYADAILRGN